MGLSRSVRPKISEICFAKFGMAVAALLIWSSKCEQLPNEETPVGSIANFDLSHTAQPYSVPIPAERTHAGEYDPYSHDHSKSLYFEPHRSDGSTLVSAKQSPQPKYGIDTSLPIPNATGHHRPCAPLFHTLRSWSTSMSHHITLKPFASKAKVLNQANGKIKSG